MTAQPVERVSLTASSLASLNKGNQTFDGQTILASSQEKAGDQVRSKPKSGMSVLGQTEKSGVQPAGRLFPQTPDMGLHRGLGSEVSYEAVTSEMCPVADMN